MADSGTTASEILGNVARQKKSVSSDYFHTALFLAFVLFGGMAILVGIVLLDLDKCEKNSSPNCPYFQNPGAEDGKNSGYHTRIRGGGNLLPDPYAK